MSDIYKRTGIITSLIILILGLFSFVYVWRELNIKNAIIGYFYTEPEIVQINDFEYDITALLFTNSGANENEYFATANAKPVSNFDRTKKYTVTINNIQANRVYGDYSYINANFTNTFISTQDKELLTDTLNIKINFYTEGTKIVFTTQNGEQAISLWTSYIAKNGFILKIIEDNYTPSIEVTAPFEPDNNVLIHYYLNGDSYKLISYNNLTDNLYSPEIKNDEIFTGWGLTEMEQTDVSYKIEDITNLSQLDFSNNKCINVYGYIIKNHTFTINYINNTGENLNIKFAKTSTIINQTNNTAKIEIKEVLYQTTLNKGSGELIIDKDKVGSLATFTDILIDFNNPRRVFGNMTEYDKNTKSITSREWQDWKYEIKNLTLYCKKSFLGVDTCRVLNIVIENR